MLDILKDRPTFQAGCSLYPQLVVIQGIFFALVNIQPRLIARARNSRILGKSLILLALLLSRILQPMHALVSCILAALLAVRMICTTTNYRDLDFCLPSCRAGRDSVSERRMTG